MSVSGLALDYRGHLGFERDLLECLLSRDMVGFDTARYAYADWLLDQDNPLAVVTRAPWKVVKVTWRHKGSEPLYHWRIYVSSPTPWTLALTKIQRDLTFTSNFFPILCFAPGSLKFNGMDIMVRGDGQFLESLHFTWMQHRRGQVSYDLGKSRSRRGFFDLWDLL